MNYTLLNDSKLVLLYQNGDEKAFEQLFKRYETKIFTTILLIVKDFYASEDLVQETFIKAVHTIRSGRYNEEGKFLSWIVRIAHNLAVDYFRRQKRYPTILLEEGIATFNSLDFAEESFENHQIRHENFNKLKLFIEKLPPKQKEVLILRHYEDMSFQEIAEITNVSVNTALGRMRYALINLRKKMICQNNPFEKSIY